MISRGDSVPNAWPIIWPIIFDSPAHCFGKRWIAHRGDVPTLLEQNIFYIRLDGGS